MENIYTMCCTYFKPVHLRKHSDGYRFLKILLPFPFSAAWNPFMFPTKTSKTDDFVQHDVKAT